MRKEARPKPSDSEWIPVEPESTPSLTVLVSLPFSPDAQRHSTPQVREGRKGSKEVLMLVVKEEEDGPAADAGKM